MMRKNGYCLLGALATWVLMACPSTKPPPAAQNSCQLAGGSCVSLADANSCAVGDYASDANNYSCVTAEIDCCLPYAASPLVGTWTDSVIPGELSQTTNGIAFSSFSVNLLLDPNQSATWTEVATQTDPNGCTSTSSQTYNGTWSLGQSNDQPALDTIWATDNGSTDYGDQTCPQGNAYNWNETNPTTGIYTITTVGGVTTMAMGCVSGTTSAAVSLSFIKQ